MIQDLIRNASIHTNAGIRSKKLVNNTTSLNCGVLIAKKFQKV